MRILIEEYQYNYEDVSDVLKGLGVLQDVEGKVSQLCGLLLQR